MKEIVAYKVSRSRDNTINKATFCDGVTHFKFDRDEDYDDWEEVLCNGGRCQDEEQSEVVSLDDLKRLYYKLQLDMDVTIKIPEKTVFLTDTNLYKGGQRVPVSHFENGVLLVSGQYVIKTSGDGQYYRGNHDGRPVCKYLGKIDSKRTRKRLDKLRGYDKVEVETTSYSGELYAIRTRKQALLQLPITPTVVKTLQIAEEAERYLLSLPYEEIDMHADDIALSLEDEIREIVGNAQLRMELRIEGQVEVAEIDNPSDPIEGSDYEPT